MALIVSNLRLSLGEDEAQAISAAKKRLGIREEQIVRASICKKSLDARHRDQICFAVSVAIELVKEETEAAYAASAPFVSWKPQEALQFSHGSRKPDAPIVVAGFGPAGIFAAHTLAMHGYRPVVFERGGDVNERAQAVERFWRDGVLDSNMNVQFGEGGAGTFSDGKLTTRISDSRCGYVLEQLVRHGAPPEIRTLAKPHIGTDRLRAVIASLREEILQLGGQVRFHSTITDFRTEKGRLCSVTANGEEFSAAGLVLAVGHSARDTFRMLAEKQVAMENKSFSVGVRIEQLQSTIDQGLYGKLAGHPALPKGEYQLSHRRGERCVYTFCMCPGGYVVPSSSMADTVVTNGMSEHARDGKNANSALVVSVGPEEYGTSLLAGMEFQQSLEERAFQLGGGGYRAPAMSVREFLKGGGLLHEGKVTPSYSLGVTGVDFSQLFPPDIIEMLRLGLLQFDRKLPGFADGDGILTGVETRTSSPIRILRSEELSSLSIQGLYPCGEGAGYAGGIVSAAVDGVRIAQRIISEFAPG